MWMTAYISEIQRQLVDTYGFPACADLPGVPVKVPDGEYPMVINGRQDHVRVVNGRISCCNFQEAGPTA